MKKKNNNISEILSTLPQNPGVYLMKDHRNVIIYIGKARSLKKRVSSYFQKKSHDHKTEILVKNITDIEYIITDSELEALLLENNLIKKHKPKYNIRLKDDKSYPYIVVTLSETYPRLLYTRKITNPADRYFGPYTDAKAARNTIDLINKIFKLKTCKKTLPLKKGERPCLNYQMQRCQGLCLQKMSAEEYRSTINNVIDFLQGNIDPVLENLTQRMQEYANELSYEKAKQIRDMIFDIQSISEQQKISVPIGYNQDYIAVACGHNEALLILFEFRKGILLGRKISIFQNIRFTDKADIIETFIVDYYERSEIPQQIITQYAIPHNTIIEKYLSEKMHKKIKITPPTHTSQQNIINLILKNIHILLADRNAQQLSQEKEQGLVLLQELLHLPQQPLRMECFDISNLQGTNSVASMVSFLNGIPNKKEYRKYKIKGYNQANDPGMIHEAVSRRLQYLLNESLPFPDLIVIDGGITQLTRANEAATALDIDVPIISIAKKMEEIYYNIHEQPLRLPPDSPALKIIQNIRDEAHRFGIQYHRKLRKAENLQSLLETIPSIGTAKRNILLQHFKTIDMIKNASREELQTLEGINSNNARQIWNFFHEHEFQS